MIDQPLIAYRVALIRRVLAAIYLDDKPLLTANKIDKVRTDRLLAHELEARKRTSAKILPKPPFREC